MMGGMSVLVGQRQGNLMRPIQSVETIHDLNITPGSKLKLDLQNDELEEEKECIFGGHIRKNFDDFNARKKLKKLFRDIDNDGNNKIDRDEFRQALEQGFASHSHDKKIVQEKINLTSDNLEAIFQSVNSDGDGEIDFNELWNFVKPGVIKRKGEIRGRKHGDMFHLLKFKFQRAIWEPTPDARTQMDGVRQTADRFRLYFHVSVPPDEIEDFENRLFGGRNGLGLYAGLEMPPSAANVPTGSLVKYVGEKDLEVYQSSEIRKIISFTETDDDCYVTFLNQAALINAQRANMPEEVWKNLTDEARTQIFQKEEVQQEHSSRPSPFGFRHPSTMAHESLYPPGHSRHTPAKRTRPLAYRIHRTMEDESYSALSYMITVAVMLLILISTAAYILETVPPLENEKELWDDLELTVSIIFTIEYLVRIWAAKNRWIYFWDAMNMVDFLAIIPYWVELVINAFSAPSEDDGKGGAGALFRVIRVIRLARVIRLMKSPTFSSYLNIFRDTLYASFSSFGLLITIFLLEIIVFASLEYVAERGTDTTISYCGDCNLVDPDESCDAGDFTSNTTCPGPNLNYSFDTPTYCLTDCVTACADLAMDGCCQYNQMSEECSFHSELPEEGVLPVEASTNTLTPLNYASECKTAIVAIRADDSISPFVSIPASVWWCVVTMTTVGYGEIYPVQTMGRLFATLTMFSGLLVIALPVIIIGKDFDNSNTAQIRKNNRKNFSKTALSKLKNDRKGTIEDFFREVNDFFKLQFDRLLEHDRNKYEYEEVVFSHDDESSFYEAGFRNRYQIEAILKCKRGYMYLPDYLHIPEQNRYPAISKYRSFCLWHVYGQFLRRSERAITSPRGRGPGSGPASSRSIRSQSSARSLTSWRDRY